MRPPMPSMLLSRRTKIAIGVVVTLIVLVILLVNLAGVYVNYLWFDSLGHRNVYNTIFWTRVTLFFVFGVLMALILGGNVAVAYLIKPPFRPMSPEQQNLQHYVGLLEPRRKLILAVVSLIALVSAGASAQGGWATWQLWLNGGSFGIKDPQFGRDISFYAFDYPVYRAMLGFGFAAIIFAIILSAIVHYLTGSIRLQTPGPKITVVARRHLTILVFVFMVLKAVAYWFDRYGLVFSDRSKFTGASYTDVHSELPAKTILFWITIVLAVGVLASIWLRSVLLPGIGFVVLLILSIVIGGIYPAAVQKFSVKPNASDKERPYILRNIDATRDAYGITTQDSKDPGGTVRYVDYSAASDPSSTALTSKNTTIDNIRILDPNVIGPTFTAQQKIGVPYAFNPKLNVDRYTLDGVTHDYVVAVREQATGSNLAGSQNNWINQHTVYTHGYGFVAAQADKDVTNGDRSDYTEGGIPPTGPLKITEPDVYFGQLGNDFSIVGAQGQKREYDGSAGAYVSYHGKGGVSLSSPLTKLALALKYKDTNFLLNDAVGAKGAKIIFVRNPAARLKKVAPFLTVDSTPYPFVNSSTGHIEWMLDGYTTMANYPYSERQSLSSLTHTSLKQGQRDTQINYIRNSVKATVDAYDGTVTIYQWDTSDPILKAYMKIFPGLVKPKKDLLDNAPVLDHIRYPEDLFDVQRGLLAQYHISNPVAAYNGKGKWGVPSDPFSTAGGNQPPYYVLASSPGSDTGAAQFQLTTPMVVNGATNLAAYISASSDPQDYGRLTVLQVPSDQTIYGPSQVANDLHSTAIIRKDITQLQQGDSEVIYGNLLTLPVGDSFLYVEPLYVESTATSGSFPTLQRVLVRYGGGDEIGYGSTLQAALDDIVQDREPGSSIGVAGETTGNGGSTSTPPTGSSTSTPTTSPSTGSTSTTTGDQTLAQVRAQLTQALADYNASKASGDLTAQVSALQKVEQLAQRLLELQGTPSGSVSPGGSASQRRSASPSGSASPSP